MVPLPLALAMLRALLQRLRAELGGVQPSIQVNLIHGQDRLRTIDEGAHFRFSRAPDPGLFPQSAGLHLPHRAPVRAEHLRVQDAGYILGHPVINEFIL